MVYVHGLTGDKYSHSNNISPKIVLCKIYKPIMPRLQSPKLSKVIWALAILISVIYWSKLGREAYNFYGDALGYYMYLPNTFIYQNHKSVERLPQDRGIRPFIHNYAAQMGSGQRTPKGYVLNQYTYGTALMEMPFFFIAHAWEKLRGSVANGFSESYRMAIGVSTLFYGVLGLWLVYRLLRCKFSQEVASITTALLLLGTNLFWFVLHQQGMAHVPLFFLFASLMWLTILVHEKGRWIHFAGLGFTTGLITVIRPVDGLCVLIPVCYAAGRPFLKTKLDFLLRNWAGILLAGACFLMPIVPQLLYWKWLTGYTIYDSYGPAQGFDFRHPHIWSGLFGASNGWLFYTPLMVLAIFGFTCIRRLGSFVLAGPLFLVLYVYCIYAWFLPNYPNGLGSRPMVDIYAVLALPMAAFIEWVGNRSRVIQGVAAMLVIVFMAINISYSCQQALGIIWSEDSNYAFNFQTFFRYHLRYNDLVVWDVHMLQPDVRKLRPVQLSYCTNIADSAFSANVITDSTGRSGKVFRIREGEEYPPLALTIPYDSLEGKPVRWIRCSGRFMAPEPEYNIYQNHLLVMQIKRGSETIAWHAVRINNKVGLLEQPPKGGEARLFNFREDVRGQVSYFVPLPKAIKAGDVLRLDVWNTGKKPLYVSELCMEGFD